METKDDSNLDDSSHRYRKFGLPNWMVNNIERLNFVTDFEQYACSPPETEGFLTEHIDSCDFHDTPPLSVDAPPSPFSVDAPPSPFSVDAPPSPFSVDAPPFSVDSPPLPVVITNDPIDEKPTITTDHKGIPESKSSPSILMGASEQIASLSIVDSIKHEDLHSSPDSTPCATPEPSPAPRRKMSGQQDTVQTNPGRWFYLGNFKKTEQNAKGQCINVNSNKENRKKSSSDKPLKLRDSPVKPKKDGIKLVISNFDINAISPSSW